MTLRGIAERLGLHVSTVSRVLNGPTGEQGRAASGETARRIRELAEELGYRPNPHATSLRTRRSNLIGVLFPRLSEIVVATIYEGVEEEAALRGLSAFVTNTHDDPATQRRRIGMVLERRVDGLIIGDAHPDGSALADPALDGTSFVLVAAADRAGAGPRRGTHRPAGDAALPDARLHPDSRPRSHRTGASQGGTGNRSWLPTLTAPRVAASVATPVRVRPRGCPRGGAPSARGSVVRMACLFCQHGRRARFTAPQVEAAEEPASFRGVPGAAPSGGRLGISLCARW
ncbi:LacI family DNA-binding transcriptional regulator [Streptomyces sp. NPDC021356]|uniref:LacI family DNA-binding transcriptional regulator n=1 Tax=Streptomyces sp. NPDC021356 TaxID=3154900 RepID=UPI00340D03C5